MQYDPNENVGTTGGAMGSTTGGALGGAATGASTDASTADVGTTRQGAGYGAETREGHDRLGKARERASELKASLADKLEQGASKLRERRTHRAGDGAALEAGAATGAGAGTYENRGEATLDRASESLAHGMESTARWVRDADLNKVRGDVEQQVRSNPGRALLVAVGVGYLLGKIFRGGGNRM
jgi:hypothetical protein